MFISEIGKANNIIATNEYADSINVKWWIKCQDMFIAKSLMLFYCPANKSNIDQCLEQENMIELNNTRLQTYRLTELKPFTKYRIWLCMKSISGRIGGETVVHDQTREAGMFADFYDFLFC